MPRARDPNRDTAFAIYKKHNGNIYLVEIASQLNLSAGTIRGWKSKDKWEQQLNGTLQSITERSKRSKGGQPNNKNAVGNEGGAPVNNKNAEKFGFFSKYLPEETKEIFDAISDADPLDLLWHQIQLAYTAIVRAQSLMHVASKDDLTKELKRQKEMSGEKADSWEKEYELQFAWDKQNSFMQGQARQQTVLNNMIKQYDEMIHKNWNTATEEQKARIALLKAQTDKITGNNQEIEDTSDTDGEIYGSD
jgi:phage terminase small subunit